jgi:hypothetical protein
MRSQWLAGILSPALVGAILYFIGTFFGVNGEIVNYIDNDVEKLSFSIESLTNQSGPAEKKSSERLGRDTKVGRLSK